MSNCITAYPGADYSYNGNNENEEYWIGGFYKEITEPGATYYDAAGELHREHGPAVINTNGTVFYYNHGDLHRTDGPAIIFYDGVQLYYINDKRYSEYEFKLMQFFKL